MYQLKCTIKCPAALKNQIAEELKKWNVNDFAVEEIPYGVFAEESRLYWDYVFPEMKTDKKAVAYISYAFPDTQEGRDHCHRVEMSLGWIPQNIRYEEV